MKKKDEVFNKFKEFKALIENHIEKKINIFQSDNFGELTSNEFEELCIDSGIKRELTTPYNPQQNGVAERKNRKIMEAARQCSMIKIFLCIYEQKLPGQLCMYKTVLHIDYSRTRHLKKVFSGKKLEVSHLRIFGCPVYIHIPKERRTKSDPS